MAPKMSKKESSKKKLMITIEMKKEIIEKHDQGMRVKDIASFFNRSQSTICTILKKKEEIKAAKVAKGVSSLSKQRPPILDDVENLLMVWLNEKQLAGDSVNENMICEKARTIYEDLVRSEPGTSAEKQSFKASRGWFEKFKKRTGIHSVVRHGEGASADTKAAESFVKEFKSLVDSEDYVSQQVFNCDETGLFWKKMPRRTYITAEEKALPGHKPMKDRLTLLFCSNASGDCKIKPLLVYHSENPRAFKKNNVQKKKLHVMWRSNTKAWVTRIFFVEWMNEVFGPEVKRYLLEKDLPLKALLLMDNAPAHPPAIEEDIAEEYKFIKVKFLPPNTTPILQPMDQQVISNFKKLYTKAMFQRCFEVTEGTNLTLREFWKDHYSIYNCLTLIDKAWQGVTRRTLNSAWKKLWPDTVAERDFEGFEPNQEEAVDEDIVSLGKAMGLEVDTDDIDDLLQEHKEQLTTEELKDLHEQQQREVIEEISSEEEGGTAKSLSSSEIKDFLKKWEDVKSFLEENVPNKAETDRAINLLVDNGVGHFYKILKNRQKQVSIEKYLVKGEKRTVKDDDQESRKRKTSDSERYSRERTPVNVPEVLMEGDSPSKQ